MSDQIRDEAGRLYEKVLVLRCQTGDDVAFAEMVQRYEKRLSYYIRRLVGPAEDVEDVLQDIWLTVYRKVRTLRSPESFKVWIYRIARNAALVRVRRRQDWTDLTEELAETGESAKDMVVLAEDVARLHAALDRLPPVHKDVLTLRFLEEMSYEDIACIVGCSVGTIRSRLHYARRSLKREMRGEP